MATNFPKLNLTPEEITLIISGLEQVVSFLLSKTQLSEEDKNKLIELQNRLNQLKSKEQDIADGK